MLANATIFHRVVLRLVLGCFAFLHAQREEVTEILEFALGPRGILDTNMLESTCPT